MNTLQNLKKYLAEIEKNDKKGKNINAFLQLRDEEELIEEAKQIDEKIKKRKAGKLAGKIIAVKANINVKGLNCSCASKTLENYKAPYDATVVKKIKEQDGLIIGLTNMDEFACGSSGETSAFSPCKNPQALDLIPGGSSSGSAAAVSAEFCDMALGSDTGGSIRNPASHCGVVGIKPTYSSVSRYGLIDMAMSFDQIGPLAKNISDAALLLNVIKGKDEKDAISQKSIIHIPTPPPSKNLTIGILDLAGLKVDNRISKLIEDKIKQVAKEYKWKIEKVKLNYIDLAVQTYYPIVYVEFFSGTRKFDGRRFGKKIEDAAGPEVLRRILGGSEISKAEHHGRYYYLALKARKLIEQEFEKAFKKVDAIICPTVPRLPHKLGSSISVEEMYSYDVLTVPANLAGICAMSIPVGRLPLVALLKSSPHPKNSLRQRVPVGMQIMCNKFEEGKMIQIGVGIEGN